MLKFRFVNEICSFGGNNALFVKPLDFADKKKVAFLLCEHWCLLGPFGSELKHLRHKTNHHSCSVRQNCHFCQWSLVECNGRGASWRK